MTRSGVIRTESETLDAMILLYCRNLHKTENDALCPSCRELLAYARSRLEKCPYGENKPACSACPIHCYKPKRRKEIQDVMRYAGPRMMRSHPMLAVRHLIKKFRKSKPVKL